MSLDVVPLVIKAQREAARNAAERNDALVEAIARLRKAEALTGMELVPRAGEPPGAKASPSSTLFGAAFAARSADRRTRLLIDSAVSRLSKELAEREAIATSCQLEIDKAAKELAQTLDASRAHKQRVSEAVAKERATLDDRGDTFFQGCAFGLGLGCLALAGYIVLTIVSIFMGRQAGATSPIGVVFLTLFIVPIGVSASLQILYGLKRMMVESELSARVRTADEVCERAVERARKTHGNIQPGLEQLLGEATAAAQKIESAVKSLTGAEAA